MENEELKSRMDRIIEWVKTCDTKASIMLSVLSLSVGIIFTSDFVLGSLKNVIVNTFVVTAKGSFSWSALFAVLSAILAVFSLLCALGCYILVLRAKTNENQTEDQHLCSTVICRASHGERHIELIPFWNYLDIWNRVDYPADLIEVLLNIALFVPIGLLLGGLGFKTKKVLLSGICLSGIIEVSQFAFCKGLCETDDVMHNSVGAFLGYLGFLGILKGKRRLFSKFSGSL